MSGLVLLCFFFLLLPRFHVIGSKIDCINSDVIRNWFFSIYFAFEIQHNKQNKNSQNSFFTEIFFWNIKRFSFVQIFDQGVLDFVTLVTFFHKYFSRLFCIVHYSSQLGAQCLTSNGINYFHEHVNRCSLFNWCSLRLQLHNVSWCA